MTELIKIKHYLESNFDLKIPDASLNGIQVANQGKVKKIISGVDFCWDLLQEAIALKGNLILVHHGIFWGKVFAIEGRYYQLLANLIKHNIALIALHLPLDVHPIMGNNIVLLKKLNLKSPKTFGSYQGIPILLEGSYAKKMNWENFLKKINDVLGKPIAVQQNNPQIKKVAICTGGGHFGIEDAKKGGCDTFVTGDAKHTSFHLSKELGINLIQAGHYQTEVFGVKALGDALAKKYHLEHQFVDIPTGL